MDAVATGARLIKSGEADVVIAGGTESMPRAPMVMPKAESAFSRKAEFYDTTIGWRFINQQTHTLYGTDSMPETAENVAKQYKISRTDQDAFAHWSQQKTAKAIAAGRLAREITPIEIPQSKSPPTQATEDDHPRPKTTKAELAKLPTPFRESGTVTAGNASGVNDGAVALILATEAAAKHHNLAPKARVEIPPFF